MFDSILHVWLTKRNKRIQNTISINRQHHQTMIKIDTDTPYNSGGVLSANRKSNNDGSYGSLSNHEVVTASISIPNGISTRTTESSPAHDEHLGKHRQYWRDIILGVNDGLVSTFLLVAGVAGGGLTSIDILLTAIAGALAGAVSMCAGEYVATKSQDEVLSGEIALENRHILQYRNDELAELAGLLTLIGIPEESVDEDLLENGRETSNTLRRQLLSHYASHPDDLLKIMIALEFGVVEEEKRSPLVAGATSCVLFFLGSLPSVIPFAFIDGPFNGLIAAGAATAVALLFVGGIKTWATRGRPLEAAMENLIIAGVGGSLAYGVGVGFDKLIRE